MATQSELNLLIKVRDEASGKLEGISGKVRGLGSKAMGALRTGAIAGGAALAGVGIASIKMGLDFGKGMAEVRTLTPDITDKAFGALKQGVLDLSKELGIATGDAVPALYQAISAGVPPENVLDFLRTSGKAAIGGVTDLATAVDGITSATNAYGPAALDATQASNQMFTAVRLGKTDFSQLSQSLFNVIPTAASLNISFGEVNAALATLTASGTPTAVATTQLRQAFVEASKGGSKLDLAIKGLTDKSFAELVKGGKTGASILEDLRQSMPEQEFKDLFGSVEAMNAVLGITGPNFAKMTANMEEMENSAGAVDGAFATMADTASFKFGKALNLLKVSLTELGVKALPFLTRMLEKLIPFLERNLPKAIKTIEGFVKDATPVVKAFAEEFISGVRGIKSVLEPVVRFILRNKPILIAALVAIGAAVVVAFGPGAVAAVAIIGFIALIGVIRKNWDKLKDILIAVAVPLGIIGAIILAALVPAFVGWAVAAAAAAIPTILLFAPVIALVAAVALISFGIIKLIRHWDDVTAALGKFKDLVVDLFNDLKGEVLGIIQGFISFLEDNWKTIVTVALSVLFPPGAGLFLIITHFGTIKEKVLGFVTGMKDRIAELLDSVVGFFAGIPGRIVSALGNMGTLLLSKGKALVDGLFAGIVEVWNRERAFWSNLPTVVKNLLGHLGGVLFNRGKDLVQGLWNGIRDMWGRLTSWVEGKVNDLIDLFKDPLDIFSPSKLFRGFGQNIVEGLIAGLADKASILDRAVGGTVGQVTGGGIAATGGGLALASAVAGAAGVAGGRPLVVILELDGRQIARVVAPHIVDEARIRLGRRT